MAGRCMASVHVALGDVAEWATWMNSAVERIGSQQRKVAQGADRCL